VKRSGPITRRTPLRRTPRNGEIVRRNPDGSVLVFKSPALGPTITDLERHVGLKRSRIKRKPPRPKPEREDKAYAAWLRTQPCCAPGPEPCRRPATVHHPRHNVGLGLRAPDRDGIPLCLEDHSLNGLHQLAGRFKGWTGEQLEAWELKQIKLHRARYALHLQQLGARPGAPS
jgi:hypothetical protein